MIQRILAVIAAAFFLCSSASAADHGVVLVYHHVSESTPPSTSVTPARFEQHLDFLEQNDFQALPLETLLDAALSGGDLPDNAVAITFDDAYESVLTEAAPRLKQREWPFTVFVASEPVDNGTSGYMSWRQLEQLIEHGGSVGAHSHTHGHLARRKEGESDTQWAGRMRQEIDLNLERLDAELNVQPTVFAYPFGEYNDTLKHLLTDRGLIGLAQQSGAVGAVTDPRQIPRFPMATGFSDMDRFKMAVNTRPLPVVSETKTGGNLSVQLQSSDLPAIGCFSASGDRLDLERVGKTGYRIDLPPAKPGRNKINCTAPSGKRSGEFFWYSYLWLGAN